MKSIQPPLGDTARGRPPGVAGRSCRCGRTWDFSQGEMADFTMESRCATVKLHGFYGYLWMFMDVYGCLWSSRNRNPEIMDNHG